MTNPLKSNAAVSLGLLLARLPLGAFFLIAGYQKVFKFGVDKFVSMATSNARHMPFEVSPSLMSMYLHAVPFLELAVGAWLVVGCLTRVGAFVGALMLVSFTIGYTGISSDQAPFQPNLIYLGMTLCLLLTGPGTLSLDRFLFGRRRADQK
jgi:uncharacterized membrane protein YphA (DoxX/SURF4 family)